MSVPKSLSNDKEDLEGLDNPDDSIIFQENANPSKKLKTGDPTIEDVSKVSVPNWSESKQKKPKQQKFNCSICNRPFHSKQGLKLHEETRESHFHVKSVKNRSLTTIIVGPMKRLT